MNDPHVVALHYRIVTSPHVDFDDAPPLRHSEPLFDVEVAGQNAVFRLKRHFATEKDAHAVVQPFVDAWNVTSGLEKGPSTFRLEYDRPELIDRAPAPGVVSGVAATVGVGSVIAVGHAKHSRFPPAPTQFAISAEVKAMYWQYQGFTEGRLPLVHMAYFLQTMLAQHGGLSAAQGRYGIHRKVLKKVGELTANKGGPNARKAQGITTNLTPDETAWLQAASVMMIRRAGEVAANPAGPHQLLTCADLPHL